MLRTLVFWSPKLLFIVNAYCLNDWIFIIVCGQKKNMGTSLNYYLDIMLFITSTWLSDLEVLYINLFIPYNYFHNILSLPIVVQLRRRSKCYNIIYCFNSSLILPYKKYFQVFNGINGQENLSYCQLNNLVFNHYSNIRIISLFPAFRKTHPHDKALTSSHSHQSWLVFPYFIKIELLLWYNYYCNYSSIGVMLPLKYKVPQFYGKFIVVQWFISRHSIARNRYSWMQGNYQILCS